MKKKFLLIIFLTLCISATRGQLNRTILFSEWSKENKLCSQSILLDSLGYFFKEQGCEGTSVVSFGTYTVNEENLVTFRFLPFDSLPPFRQIKRIRESGDSIVKITFYDRDDKPLVFAFNLSVLDKAENTHSVYSDENGQFFLDRNKYKDLIIGPLLWIYGASPSLITGDETMVEVHLSLPVNFLLFTEIHLDKPGKLELVLKKDGLYSPDQKTKIYSTQ